MVGVENCSIDGLGLWRLSVIFEIPLDARNLVGF